MRTTSRWSGVAILVLLSVFLIGSDGCGPTSPPASDNEDPFARFDATQTEFADGFVVEATNRSTNHNEGTENLTYRWSADGQDDTNVKDPEWTWTYPDLGLDEVDDEATRKIFLTVTEGGDPERRSSTEKTVLFKRTKGSSSTVIRGLNTPAGQPVSAGAERAADTLRRAEDEMDDWGDEDPYP